MPAPWAYIDTSVLLKRYVKESGTPQARRLLRRYRVVSSAIAPVEAASALWRRKTGGDVTDANFAAIRARLARDRGHWELVELTGDVLARAEQVVEQVGVRTLDAIHLASALILSTAAGADQPVAFVTADARQRDAAGALGLQVTWIG